MLGKVHTIVAITGLLLAALIARAEGELSLAAVRIDGAEAKEAPGVLRKAAGEARAQPVTLRVGEAIAEGVEVTAPPRVRLEFASRHGNRITLNPGARLLVGRVAERGEAHALQSGEASFSVKNALDFYQVSYKRFLATVRGTEYRIRVEEGKEIAFAVAEGEVEVERTGKVAVATADDVKDAESVREAERLPAGSTRSYALDVDEYLRKFSSYADAETYYRGALEIALASGDEAEIRRARENMGIVLATFSRYEEARSEFEAGLALARKRFGEGDHASIASFLHLVGGTHVGMGEYAKAQSLYDLAFSMHRRLTAGAEDDFTARMFSSVGKLALQRSEFRAALENVTRADEIMSREAKPDRLLRFRVRSLLGAAQFEMGEFAASARTLEQALALQRELDGDRDSLARITVLNNLAGSASRASDYRGALEYGQQALAMSRRLYDGRDQESIAGILNVIATNQVFLSQFPQAAESYREAAEMFKRLFGQRDHPRISEALVGMGRVFLLSSRPHEALGPFEEALAISRRLANDKDHATTAWLLVNLGVAYGATGRHEAALGAYNEAEGMYERLQGGRDSDERVHLLLSMAWVRVRIDDPQGAHDLAQRALKMARVLHGVKDHKHVGDALYILGTTTARTGDIRKGFELMEEAAGMRERLLGSGDSMEMVQTYVTLGDTHNHMGAAKDAIAPLEKALAMSRRLFGNKDSVPVAGLLSKLGLCYHRSGFPAKALASLQESVAMMDRVLAGKDHDGYALSLGYLSIAQLKEGDVEAAIENASRGSGMMARGGAVATYGLVTHSIVSDVLVAAGRFKEATAELDLAWSLARRRPSADKSANLHEWEGELRIAMGSYQEGIEILSRALRETQEVLRSDANDSVLRLHISRARAHLARADIPPAEVDLRRAAEIASSLYGDYPSLPVQELRLAQATLHSNRGEFAQRRKAVEEALAMKDRRDGIHRADMERVNLLLSLADAELEMGQPSLAAAHVGEAENSAASLREGPRRRAESEVAIARGRFALSQGVFDAAAAHFENGLPVLRQRHREVAGIELAEVLAQLAAAEAGGGNAERAAALVEEAEAIRQRTLGDRDHPLARRLLEARARMTQAGKDPGR
ncbi:MAG: tetratricopeptide repeat protein [Usitatibacter sp.]